jgi:Ca2+-binding EF-hand superfamily protein
MLKKSHFAAFVAVPALMHATAVFAQSAPKETGFELANEIFLNSLYQDTSREGFTANILVRLSNIDSDKNGLQRSEVNRLMAIQNAQQRGRLASEFLKMDLSGDLQVTQAEIVQFLGSDQRFVTETAQQKMTKLDFDNNGVITLQEALDEKIDSRFIGREDFPQKLMALDPNNDDQLTIEELRAVATRFFDAFDTDRNGFISHDENDPIETQRKILNQIYSHRQAGCSFQNPASASLLLAYSQYRGRTYSDVYIGGDSIETTVINVEVKPGKQPLYLLLRSNESVIWHFSGDTKRIEKVVTASEISANRRNAIARPLTSATGVIGIAADKVQITNGTCLPDFNAVNTKTVSQEILRAALGRKLDEIGEANAPGNLVLPPLRTLPLDQKSTVPKSFDAEIWKNMVTEYSPAEFQSVNSAEVVAAEPVGSYKILPGYMGLAQLAGSGHLDHYKDKIFTIRKPFAHFPIGLAGGNSVTFVLPKGIEKPKGELGHSCIMSEEEAVAQNWVCRPPPPPTPIPPPPPPPRHN